MSEVENVGLRFAPKLLLCVAILGWQSVSSAQPSSQAKAAAEALFDEGLALLKSGDYPNACKKLESSERVEPAVGTLLYLGECYARLERTASAWATFREASSLATESGQQDRAKQAKARADELTPNLAHVTIIVPQELLKLPGLAVLRGSEPIDIAVLGTSTPVDPGRFEVEVRANGYEPFHASVDIAAASRSTVQVPALRPLPPPPASTSKLSSGSTTTSPSTAPKTPLKRELSTNHVDPTQRNAGIVLMGVGLGGVGLGTYLGLKAISQNSKAESGTCSATLCQKQSDLDLVNSARHMAMGADIAMTVGVAAIAGGILTYWLSPSVRQTGLTIQPQFAGRDVGLQIGGAL